MCRFHGGAATQVKARGQLRIVEAEAAKAIKGVLIEPVANPLEALAEIGGEILAFKDWLRSQMEALGSLESYDDKGAENIKAVFAAYERALDRSVVALATIGKLNIDERLARIEEAKQMIVIRAFEAGLAAVGIAGPQAVAAKEAFARSLRAA